MSGPSRHLSWDELACRDGTPYPEKWRKTRAIELAAAFERIRFLYGGGIGVSSGYRTEAYNRKVGGARLSQHVQGRALDLRPMYPTHLGQLLLCCEQAGRRAGCAALRARGANLMTSRFNLPLACGRGLLSISLMCARGSTDVIPRTRLLARAHLAGDERASPQPLPAHTLAASSRAQEAASRARGVQRADARCQLLLYVCLTAAALRP